MKKAIFCIGLVTILLLTGFSTVSAIENKTNNTKETGQTSAKASTVYGPFIAPSIIGGIFLQEDASYTAKHQIGKLYIYRDIKLTGIAHGPGPQDPEEPRYALHIQQFPFIGGRIVDCTGRVTLTMKLWIGPAIAVGVGGDAVFIGHYGQGFDVTLETLE